MKKTDSAYYYSIKGLLIPRDCKYEKIHNKINKYIDLIEGLAKSLDKTFEEGYVMHFGDHMKVTISLLEAVYARWLATEAQGILRCAQSDLREQVKTRLKPFITELLTLSIEMQKAQNRDADNPDEKDENVIEQHADIVNNILAIETLIAGGEYEQAHSLITAMKDSNCEAALGDLQDCIVSGDYEEAGELARMLRENHLDVIYNMTAAGSKAQKSILAVDDKPEILSVITSILKERYKVYAVTNGAAAIKLMKTKKPDLFILDIEMPGFDGYELAGIIRKQHEHINTPIIFLTGNSSREHVLKAMQAGGNDFVIKPANNELLLTKARKYLEAGGGV